MSSDKDNMEPESGAGAIPAEQKAEEMAIEAVENREGKKTKADPVRRFTLIVLAACALLFVWHVLSDRFVPFTSQAKIHAYIVPITPQVSGYVTEVTVNNNEVVTIGQPLLQIDPYSYELALENAEAALEQAGQAIGADTAAVDSAQASLLNAKAKLRQAQQNYDLVKNVYDLDPGAVSKFELTNRKTAVAVAITKVSAAEADLAKSKEKLGRKGRDNARIKSALAALEQARLNLEWMTIRSPGHGSITNLQIDVGQYAGIGQPLMTYVSTTDVWIQADMRENNLGNIKQGDTVELALDVAPGRIFRGHVSSIGWGVSRGGKDALGALPTIETTGGWLKEAQRFPVIIKFSDEAARGFRRPGGQASVIVYTGGHPFLNALGRWWIRLVSYFSYVY